MSSSITNNSNNGHTNHTSTSVPNATTTTVTEQPQKLDKEKIAKLIDDCSKGTPFYEHQKRKEAQRDKKNEKLLEKSAEYSLVLKKEEIAAIKASVDAEVDSILKNAKIGRFAHIDMDAFYASVEELDQPHLKRIPMAVGSSAILGTCNYPARRFGVKSGMPGFIARKLCPQLAIVPPHFEKYKEATEKIRQVARTFDPNIVTPFGGDELYVELNDTNLDNWRKRTKRSRKRNSDNNNKSNVKNNSVDGNSSSEIEKNLVQERSVDEFLFVQDLRMAIFEATKLECSAGIGPTPALAKIASDLNKPNGQFALEARTLDEIKEYAWNNLAPKQIPGIGKATDAMLQKLGIHTCKQLFETRNRLKHIFPNHKMFSFLLQASLGLSGVVVGEADHFSIMPSAEKKLKSIGDDNNNEAARENPENNNNNNMKTVFSTRSVSTDRTFESSTVQTPAEADAFLNSLFENTISRLREVTNQEYFGKDNASNNPAKCVSILVKSIGMRARLKTFEDKDTSAKVYIERNNNNNNKSNNDNTTSTREGCHLLFCEPGTVLHPAASAQNKKSLEAIKRKLFEISSSSSQRGIEFREKSSEYRLAGFRLMFEWPPVKWIGPTLASVPSSTLEKEKKCEPESSSTAANNKSLPTAQNEEVTTVDDPASLFKLLGHDEAKQIAETKTKSLQVTTSNNNKIKFVIPEISESSSAQISKRSEETKSSKALPEKTLLVVQGQEMFDFVKAGIDALPLSEINKYEILDFGTAQPDTQNLFLVSNRMELLNLIFSNDDFDDSDARSSQMFQFLRIFLQRIGLEKKHFLTTRNNPNNDDEDNYSKIRKALQYSSVILMGSLQNREIAATFSAMIIGSLHLLCPVVLEMRELIVKNEKEKTALLGENDSNDVSSNISGSVDDEKAENINSNFSCYPTENSFIRIIDASTFSSSLPSSRPHPRDFFLNLDDHVISFYSPLRVEDKTALKDMMFAQNSDQRRKWLMSSPADPVKLTKEYSETSRTASVLMRTFRNFVNSSVKTAAFGELQDCIPHAVDGLTRPQRVVVKALLNLETQQSLSSSQSEALKLQKETSNNHNPKKKDSITSKSEKKKITAKDCSGGTEDDESFVYSVDELADEVINSVSTFSYNNMNLSREKINNAILQLSELNLSANLPFLLLHRRRTNTSSQNLNGNSTSQTQQIYDFTFKISPALRLVYPRNHEKIFSEATNILRIQSHFFVPPPPPLLPMALINNQSSVFCRRNNEDETIAAESTINDRKSFSIWTSALSSQIPRLKNHRFFPVDVLDSSMKFLKSRLRNLGSTVEVQPLTKNSPWSDAARERNKKNANDIGGEGGDPDLSLSQGGSASTSSSSSSSLGNFWFRDRQAPPLDTFSKSNNRGDGEVVDFLKVLAKSEPEAAKLLGIVNNQASSVGTTDSHNDRIISSAEIVETIEDILLRQGPAVRGEALRESYTQQLLAGVFARERENLNNANIKKKIGIVCLQSVPSSFLSGSASAILPRETESSFHRYFDLVHSLNNNNNNNNNNESIVDQISENNNIPSSSSPPENQSLVLVQYRQPELLIAEHGLAKSQFYLTLLQIKTQMFEHQIAVDENRYRFCSSVSRGTVKLSSITGGKSGVVDFFSRFGYEKIFSCHHQHQLKSTGFEYLTDLSIEFFSDDSLEIFWEKVRQMKYELIAAKIVLENNKNRLPAVPILFPKMNTEDDDDPKTSLDKNDEKSSNNKINSKKSSTKKSSSPSTTTESSALNPVPDVLFSEIPPTVPPAKFQTRSLPEELFRDDLLPLATLFPVFFQQDHERQLVAQTSFFRVFPEKYESLNSFKTFRVRLGTIGRPRSNIIGTNSSSISPSFANRQEIAQKIHQQNEELFSNTSSASSSSSSSSNNNNETKNRSSSTTAPATVGRPRLTFSDEEISQMENGSFKEQKQLFMRRLSSQERKTVTKKYDDEEYEYDDNGEDGEVDGADNGIGESLLFGDEKALGGGKKRIRAQLQLEDFLLGDEPEDEEIAGDKKQIRDKNAEIEDEADSKDSKNKGTGEKFGGDDEDDQLVSSALKNKKALKGATAEVKNRSKKNMILHEVPNEVFPSQYLEKQHFLTLAASRNVWFASCFYDFVSFSQMTSSRQNPTSPRFFVSSVNSEHSTIKMKINRLREAKHRIGSSIVNFAKRTIFYTI